MQPNAFDTTRKGFKGRDRGMQLIPKIRQRNSNGSSVPISDRRLEILLHFLFRACHQLESGDPLRLGEGAGLTTADDPSMIETVTWPETGAPYEHAGFGRYSNDAKNGQTEFFSRTL